MTDTPGDSKYRTIQANSFGTLLRSFRDAIPAPPTKANRFEGSRWRQSLHETAKRAGIDPSYLMMLERGERQTPSRATVEALAVALILTPAETDLLLATAGYFPWQLNDRDLATVLKFGRAVAERRRSEAAS